MSDTITLTLAAVRELSFSTLRSLGLSVEQSNAVSDVLVAGQRDECHSHGLYRLLVCARTISAGKVALDAQPILTKPAPSVVQIDAKGGYSQLAFKNGLPSLIETARTQGLAALAINNCVHFAALWPEVEAIAERGLVGLAMSPSHSWVAPAGGTKPVFGTNPLAFSWPRPNALPFVFDFATSAVARGDIELHYREGNSIPAGWGVNKDGEDTTDASEVLDGAMKTFGGHKGSALSAMVELMAGPLIGDLTSMASQEHDEGVGASPFHGELIVAIDPRKFPGNGDAQRQERAEALFHAIVGQGARLPSQRRYAARERTDATGVVTIPKKLYEDIISLGSGS